MRKALYVCPTCKRRWLDENAEANGFCCFRSCDTPLVHMEEEAGPHLNYLDRVRLGAESGITDLREAVLAVRPGGEIEIPPGRHHEPLVLDKPLHLKRAGDGNGEVFLEASDASALRVLSAGVVVEGITFFREASEGNFPLVEVRSGDLDLRQSRLDCRRAPGILVRGEATLTATDCTVNHSAGYAVRGEEKANLALIRLQLNGSGAEGTLAVAAAAPLSIGVGLSGEEGASLTGTEVTIRDYPLGLLLKGCTGTVRQLDIRNCEQPARLAEVDHLRLEKAKIQSSAKTLVEAQGGAATFLDCEFTGGEEQLFGSDANLTVEHCRFARAGRVACQLEGNARSRISRCTIRDGEGNGIVVDRKCRLEIENTRVEALAGVAILALEGAEPAVSGGELCGCGAGLCALTQARPRMNGTIINDSRGSGVLLQDGAGGAFHGLQISSSGADQFVVGKSGETASLRDCRFERGRAGGIRLADGARAEIHGGAIEGANGSGLILGKRARARAENLTISACGNSGVLAGGKAELELIETALRGNHRMGLWAVQATRILITGSRTDDEVRIAGNGLGGLFLDRVAATELHDLRLEENLGPGLTACGGYADDPRPDVKLHDCTLRGNHGEGALVLGAVDLQATICTVESNEPDGVRSFGRAQIQATECSFAPGAGLACRVGRWAQAVLSGCAFEGKGKLIRLDSGSETELRGNRYPGKWKRSVRRYLFAAVKQSGS